MPVFENVKVTITGNLSMNVEPQDGGAPGGNPLTVDQTNITCDSTNVTCDQTEE